METTVDHEGCHDADQNDRVKRCAPRFQSGKPSSRVTSGARRFSSDLLEKTPRRFTLRRARDVRGRMADGGRPITAADLGALFSDRCMVNADEPRIDAPGDDALLDTTGSSIVRSDESIDGPPRYGRRLADALAPRERRLLRRRRRVSRDPCRPVPRRDRLGRPMRRGRRAQVARQRRLLVPGDVAGGADGRRRRSTWTSTSSRRSPFGMMLRPRDRTRTTRRTLRTRRTWRPPGTSPRVAPRTSGTPSSTFARESQRRESRAGPLRDDFRRRRRLASPATRTRTRRG